MSSESTPVVLPDDKSDSGKAYARPCLTLSRMFEAYSSGYYLGRLVVEPHAGDRAVMQKRQHELVNEQLYATGRGVERLDLPLVMKLDNRHFAVHGDETVPEDTLALPASVIDDSRVDNPPTLREVLLAKADRAEQLLRIAAGTVRPREMT